MGLGYPAGKTIDEFVLADSIIYNGSDKTWHDSGNKVSMREARVFHSCSTLKLSSGLKVAVVIGGEDQAGNALSSCEIYYISNGQWADMSKLPKQGSGSVAVTVNNRLILLGGKNKGAVQNTIWIYHEKTGWHYLNKVLDTPLHGHIVFPWTLNDNLWYEETETGYMPFNTLN